MANFTTISNIKTTAEFGLINFESIIAATRTPRKSRAATPATAKLNSPLVAAHDQPTRNKAEASTGNFGMLRADLDNAGTQTADDLAVALREQGIERFVIYSTLSHTEERHRYRVIVPSDGVMFERWQEGQFYLAEVLPDADPCADRPAQFMILPTVTRESAQDYDYAIGEGEPLTESGIFWQNAESHATALAAKVPDVATLATTQCFVEGLIGAQISIIGLVNDAYDWPDLLESFGYKRKGLNAWVAPESQSGMPGTHLLTSSTNSKQRLFSHHANDPIGGQLVDKLDFIAIRSYGSDRVKALADIAKTHFPTVYAHNLREWQTVKDNTKIRTVVEGLKK